MLISLDSVDKTIRFVNAASRFDKDIKLKSGIYVVDAKSIMGVFCLDLTKPIELITNDIEDEILEKFLNDFIYQKIDKYNMEETMYINMEQSI